MKMIGDKVKFKAFTLLELVLVMLIGGIVSFMVSKSLFIVHSYYITFSKKREKIIQLENMKKNLKIDIKYACQLQVGKNEIRCYNKENIVTYHIKSDRFLRNDKLGNNEVIKVNNIIIDVNKDQNESQFQLINMSFLYEQETIFWSFIKKNTVTELLQNETL